MSVWEPWRPLEKAFVRHRIRVLAFQLIALRIIIWSCCNNNILAGPSRKDLINFRLTLKFWACLKRRHVYEAVWSRGRVAEINFG